MCKAVQHFSHRILQQLNMSSRMTDCQCAYAICPSLTTACVEMLAWARAGIVCDDVRTVNWSSRAILFQFSHCQEKVADTRLISSWRSRHSSCHRCAWAWALHHSTQRANAKSVWMIQDLPAKHVPDCVLWSAFIPVPCTVHIHFNFLWPSLVSLSRDVNVAMSSSSNTLKISPQLNWFSGPAKDCNAFQTWWYLEAVASILDLTRFRRLRLQVCCRCPCECRCFNLSIIDSIRRSPQRSLRTLWPCAYQSSHSCSRRWISQRTNEWIRDGR